MNSVTVSCTCGKEIGKYVKVIDFLSKCKYKKPRTYNYRSLETNNSIKDIYDLFKFRVCCRMQLTGRITIDEKIGL